MMRVAIDVSGLNGGLRSGTGIYLYRLVQSLAAARPDDEFDVLYNAEPGEGAELARSLEAPNVQVTCERMCWRYVATSLVWRPYPAGLRRIAAAADVFHMGEFVFPRLAHTPVVATVHDITTRLFPQWHRLENRVLHARRLRWIARHAARVIVDAEATRQDVVTGLGIPRERLDVVPLAAGHEAPPASPMEIAQVRARHGIGDAAYVLYAGTLEPRKNLVRLVEAFRRRPSELAGSRLVLAGAWGWHPSSLREAIAGAGAEGGIITTGGVTASELAALYAGATVFAYPSLYEGFGLPVLEAMRAGVPVITTRCGSLAEVAGDAAVIVDPHSADELSAALTRLLRSPEERDRYRRAGREREARYTWSRTAELTFQSYERAVTLSAVEAT